MTVFLTSDVGASKKVDGVRTVTPLNNTNSFIENLMKYVKSEENFVFVASAKDAFDVNDSYANLTFNSFNMSGFNFKKLQLLDSRTLNQAEEYIKNASVVFLAGGNTINQMHFFDELNLSGLLKKYRPIVIGQSAGALNLAHQVYCSPEDEDELDCNRYFKGLGLTKVNIEPHFKHSPHFGKFEVLEKILIEDSFKMPFIAITDGSYIIDDGTSQVLYGEGYYFKDGSCTQISKDKEVVNISKYISNN